ncbi:MAG: hypothetical protein ACYC63_17665 [Armatimonadota bacterium]
MKCPSEVELNEFAEDRLESRRRWEIQEHLEQCAGCSADLEGLDWITGCLGVIDTADESAEVEHPADADLAALAEGRVAPDLKAELLTHLSVCAECARVFGSLPRKSGKLAISRSFYSFAAAAVLMIAIGVFAFTGQFAHMGKTARTMVATEMADAKRGESEPAATKAPSVPPAVVAQQPAPEAAPEPEAVTGVSKAAPAAFAANARTLRHRQSVARHFAPSRQPRADSLDNTQIAMGETHPTPEAVSDMPRSAAPKAAEGNFFNAMKSTPPAARPAPPSAGASAAAMGAPGGSGVAATALAPSAPTTRATQQRSQTKSQMIQQSQQAPAAAKKKAAAKSAAKSLKSDDDEKGQELRQTGDSADNSGKSKVKSSAADGSRQTGSSQSGSGDSDSSPSIAGHGPIDTGQSPPGNHDA